MKELVNVDSIKIGGSATYLRGAGVKAARGLAKGPAGATRMLALVLRLNLD